MTRRSPAQALGFRGRPASDLDGRAYKLAILAGLAFHSRINDDIYVQGIREVTREDIRYARDPHTVKLLALGSATDGQAKPWHGCTLLVP